MAKGMATTARAVALAGPYGSGKTTLLDALVFAAGQKTKIGSVAEGDTLGDWQPEARARGVSTEASVASVEFLGDQYYFVDLPGSVEFAAEARGVLPAMDMAIVVADPDPERAIALQPILMELDGLGVPHVVFVNRIDEARARARDLLSALQDVSPRPLVMRQIPIWEGEKATGFIDLALERAFVYRTGEPSQRVAIPSALADREADARFQMLEKLADYDDALMEQLLEDAVPDPARVFADLAEEFRQGLITPVFLGAAKSGGGVRRLLKALRHECPPLAAAAARAMGGPVKATAVVQTLKTSYAGQAGKVSLARVLQGVVEEGATFTRADGGHVRAGAIMGVHGAESRKRDKAGPGDVVAIARLGDAATGELLVVDGEGMSPVIALQRPEPVFARAVHVDDRKDEVKLTSALAKLAEEDLGVQVGPDPETGELLVRGQGEIHIAASLERLNRKFGVSVVAAKPRTPYKETIRKSATKRGRHKKQTGGHGQFGDCVLEVGPLPRGEGFRFDDKITGGVIPRTYIPAVEDGVKDAMLKGPLGFPVVDVTAAVIDGSYHSVDSSEIAFRTAGRIGMSEALPDCAPVLLEPILKVEITAPSEAMSKVTSILSSRRGQILGFDAREGWAGWDRIEAHLPQAEVGDLIIELRSASQGLASFSARFDRMAELTGRLADQVVQSHGQASHEA